MSTNTSVINSKPMVIGIVLGIIIGCILTFGAYTLLAPTGNEENTSAVSEANKPLYWVAPMDANYRKDKPGKSPMGMDLIAVYDDGGKGSNEGAGTIRISPDVVNNLGVRMSTATYKSLQRKINTVGYVTYDEDKLVHIHPRVEGWIEKLHVTAVGDPVEKGQPLYEIYAPELVNAQEEFLLALDRKNNRLISAAQNRLLALQIPKSVIAELKKTKKVQQRITFFASQSGVVENLPIKEGFFVKPETMMLSIVDLTQVWVKAEVFERQIAQLSMGNDVVMTLDYLPNKQWYGKIEHIHPMLNPKTRTGIARLRFDNMNGELKPNMFAQIVITTTGNESALLIPKEALIRTGKQDRVVLALGEGSFKSVAVRVGRYNNESVEILEGLSEGEQVVSSAQFLLDSESSKLSDFKRMNHDTSASVEGNSEASSATVTGTINSLMIDHGMINISRSEIEKWNRPAATMDFITDEKVSLEGLAQGMKVEFTFEIRDENFVIVNISPFIDSGLSEGTFIKEAPTVDHSNH